MAEWQEIRDDRLQWVHPDGFLVIKPIGSEKPIPFFCPVCEGPMKKADDGQAYRKYECCSDCAVKWAERNKEKWAKDWRPQNQ